MALADDMRFEVSRSINTLRRRFANTLDQAERDGIMGAIRELNDTLTLLNQAALLDAAAALAEATHSLERAVAAARTGPFDGYLAALDDHFRNFTALAGAALGQDRLPPAPDAPPAGAAALESMPRPGAKRPAQGKARGTAKGGARAMPRDRVLAPPVTDFASLAAEYQRRYDTCTVRRGNEGVVAWCAQRLRQNRPLYEAVGADLNGIPWAFIGAIHGMECSFRLDQHLHNGDPLTGRTVHVPRGRPQLGAPPFTWRESAADALRLKKLDQQSDWSIPRMLHRLEGYNGFGYRRQGIPTPYLWSMSNHYTKGKYTADGQFDPNAVSKQCGAAVMLKAVLGG